jgi:hypothetical protein
VLGVREDLGALHSCLLEVDGHQFKHSNSFMFAYLDRGGEMARDVSVRPGAYLDHMSAALQRS